MMLQIGTHLAGGSLSCASSNQEDSLPAGQETNLCFQMSKVYDKGTQMLVSIFLFDGKNICNM